jgi:hypothetical protein
MMQPISFGHYATFNTQRKTAAEAAVSVGTALALRCFASCDTDEPQQT